MGRLAAESPPRADMGEPGRLVRPTYTFDVTKMDLEAMQALVVEGSDETAGARSMSATNEESTAVDQFMAARADEKGSFFLGRDPALYRVQGEPVALGEVLKAGCERQQAGMRLIEVETAPLAPETAAPDESEQETDS